MDHHSSAHRCYGTSYCPFSWPFLWGSVTSPQRNCYGWLNFLVIVGRILVNQRFHQQHSHQQPLVKHMSLTVQVPFDTLHQHVSCTHCPHSLISNVCYSRFFCPFDYIPLVLPLLDQPWLILSWLSLVWFFQSTQPWSIFWLPSQCSTPGHWATFSGSTYIHYQDPISDHN